MDCYFPVGHWTLTQPPKTFETGNAMIVLDDYEPGDNGQVRVTKCVILFFPRPRERGEPPPRDADFSRSSPRCSEDPRGPREPVVFGARERKALEEKR